MEKRNRDRDRDSQTDNDRTGNDISFFFFSFLGSFYVLFCCYRRIEIKTKEKTAEFHTPDAFLYCFSFLEFEDLETRCCGVV